MSDDTELRAKIARLRLTPEEREAVEIAAFHAEARCQAELAATLRGLLERITNTAEISSKLTNRDAAAPRGAVVRLPPLDPNGAPGWNAAIGAVRQALADAGVDWDTE